MERVRRHRFAVRNDPRKYEMEPMENQISMNVPVLYVKPAAPENVQAVKFAMYNVIPEAHHGIMLPPAKYSLAPLLNFMK
jgi:hypothetical protein